MTCLIIDDDQDDQEIFLMCVHRVSKDINCSTADDGVQALNMLSSQPEYIPDYIFLDVNMPKMNGLNCLKELKKIKRLESTKILMYSTTSEPGIVAESKELGAHDFIVKPAKTGELKERLYHIFKIVPDMNN